MYFTQGNQNREAETQTVSANNHLPNSKNHQKCGIIGCGTLGSILAYTLMQAGLFSELVLLDTDRRQVDRLAADLTLGFAPGPFPEIYAGDPRDLADASILLFTMESDGTNGSFPSAHRFQTLLLSVLPYSSDAILLLAAPSAGDLLTRLALDLSGFPPERVMGIGTVAETDRLKQLVAGYLCVHERHVNTFILGEQGESEFAVWSSASICGIPLDQYCRICGKGTDKSVLYSLFDGIKTDAFPTANNNRILSFSVAKAMLKIVTVIALDENAVLPVSICANGHYGLEQVCLALPAVVGERGVRRIPEILLNEEEECKLTESARKLQLAYREFAQEQRC